VKLEKITIKNYRSIQNQNFVLNEKNKSFTYTLIGINESGKSSFLNAISLVNEGEVVYPRDFFDENEPIEVILTYSLTINDSKFLNQELTKKNIDKDVISKIKITEVEVGVIFEKEQNYQRNQFEKISFKEESISNFYMNGSLPQKKPSEGEYEDLKFSELFKIVLPDFFYKRSHYITFWKSDTKHLIGEKINLDTFSVDPENVSVPLYNCFQLAKIKDIKEEVARIKTDTAERQNLADKLSDVVTEHIKKVWPSHQVNIKFNINNDLIEFLVEDTNVKYKTKTTGQRSDGFKQFISFLLTISAEHANQSLSRSILLLDEPETHLHPQAQEFLREELIKITKSADNNIVFFATHSSYMIDRDDIDRCYKIEKVKNSYTTISEISGSVSSYAEVNYDVFGISSSDYHNELYGIIQEKSGKYNIDDFDSYLELQKIGKDKDYKKLKKDGTIENQKVTLPTYIRNVIHHPENNNNDKYSIEELNKSIIKLLKLR
jgi:predicted ATP-dependent endonuclease of OLD family